MSEPRRRRFPCSFFLLAPCFLAVTGAEAVDRPGTPIGVVVGADMTPGRLPAIAVHFHNTANEIVTFWCEWKVNGELRGDPLKSLSYPKIQCLKTASCTGVLNHSTTAADRVQKPVESLGIKVGTTSEPIEVAKDKGFEIVDLDWDTEYCFHLKARIESSGIVSGEWSQWSCGRTPPLPPLPAAFPRPVATFLPGETGGVSGRSIDGINPDRVLLEWENAGGAAHYEIEGPGRPYKNAWSFANNVFVDSMKTKQTALFDVSGQAPPYFYTICAVNARGRRCSGRVSTTLIRGKAVTAARIPPTPVPPAKLATGALHVVSTPTPAPAARKALRPAAH